MSDRFIDTNIVIYSISQDEVRKNIAIDLLAQNPVIWIGRGPTTDNS